ncbi:uncharacterized protein LOC112342093 isoform X1 [Selaginella moellendorffii]|uniref:uncharacterized protein LOC112342093 isoform X1 n=1 Tax=Selaginella moellendorffii TaxID=88036 RepID=UPI000D1CA8A4|nr:uncharacterized protein LOC112342093 isoform X1 [Selaginella moellendorffii]|eukprot:XP_024519128.1 uncharacterized protein LOC112342093 isoform X1 [Selaginella moellendorffii]
MALAMAKELFSIASNRWIVAVSGFYLIAITGGTLTSFSLFSQELKISLHYKQESVNTISFFKDLGTSMAFLAGLLNARVGPRLTMFVSALLNLFGYTMAWLAITHQIARPPAWQMSFYMFLVGASVGFAVTAVLTTCATNFPKHHQGMLLSLLDGSNGLGATAFAVVFQTFFQVHARSFLLFLGLLPTFLYLLLGLFLGPVPVIEKSSDKSILRSFLITTFALAAYLLVVTVIEGTIPSRLPDSVPFVFFGLMLLIVLLPVALVVRAKIRSHSNSAGAVESIPPSHNSEAQLADMNSTPSSLQVVDHSPSQASSAGIHRWFQVPARGKDYRLVHALLSIDMWLMLIATSCGLGTVSTFYNNLGQLSASLGYSTARMNIFVALLNLWDFLGAIGCGFVSEILLHKFGIGRPFVFAAVVGFLALGNLLIALGLPGALYIGSTIIGLATGGQWAVLSTIIAEIFGLKHYGVLQSFPNVAKGIGTYVLSVEVAGVFYDRQARRYRGPDTLEASLLCDGAKCYRETFFVMGATCLFGCAIAVALSLRSAKFYSAEVRPSLTRKVAAVVDDAC